MKVAVFFLCLCILLLKGYDHMHTAAHQNNICFTPALHIEQTQQVKYTDPNQDYALIKDADSDNEEEDLISDDKVEDEDPNSVSARKDRLPVKCYLIPSHLFISHYLYSCSKAPLTLCGLLSYKYITQKVLRI